MTSKHDDVRPFVVTVLAPEHLLAEKVRALSSSWLWLLVAFLVFNTLTEGLFADAVLPITLAGIPFGLCTFSQPAGCRYLRRLIRQSHGW